MKKQLHAVKGQPDQRRQQENHVHGIDESLAVLGIVGARRVESAPVISLLNFEGNFRAVRISVAQQQFPRP